jgi:biopolymer transport protein ExbD
MKFKTNLKTSTSLIDLTPLVDVIFLMLIFFIVTSETLPVKSLNIQNPTLDKNSTPLTTQLLLLMDAQHVIYVGNKKDIVDFESLKEHLEQHLAALTKENNGLVPTLVLSVDRSVEYGLFLKLFSIAQECCPKMRLAYQYLEESHE